MSTPRSQPLHVLLPPWTLLPGALAFALLGALMARALMALPDDQIPDVTLRLAALLTVPLPPLVLHLVTTPPHAATRRLLGESASGIVRASRRDALRWTFVALVTPLTLAVIGYARQNTGLLHVAAALAATVALVAGLSFAAMLHGLRLLAGGRHAGWTAVSGGGAFGPAEAAPLLYLPAFALIGGLTPVALLAAVWNVRPEILTAGVWQLLPAVGIAIGLRLASLPPPRASTFLHAGLRAAEQAHASRFAEADGLAEPPTWLTTGQPAPALQFLARSWHRRWPVSGLATAVLAGASLLLVRADAPAWLVAVTAGAFAAVAQTRVLALLEEAVWPASRWLGLSANARRAALVRLSLGLGLPSLALVLGLTWQHRTPVALIGAAIGTAASTAVVRSRGATAAWPYGAWIVFAASLALAATGGL